MGFFTKPDAAADGGALAPLTHERIAGRLDAGGYNYGVDDDGDIGGRWDDHLFYFFRYGPEGEFLQVRGRWSRSVPVSERSAVLDLANEWNAEKIWPKVYVRPEGDELGVYCEHSVDYEHGVSDEQIDLHLAAGVSTSLQFFTRLDEAYPEAVAAFQAEQGPAEGGDA